jgi:hypothetical protein
MSSEDQPSLAIGQNNHVRAKFVDEDGNPYTGATVKLRLVDGDGSVVPDLDADLEHDSEGEYTGVLTIPDSLPVGNYQRWYTGEAAEGVPINHRRPYERAGYAVVGALAGE